MLLEHPRPANRIASSRTERNGLSPLTRSMTPLVWRAPAGEDTPVHSWPYKGCTCAALSSSLPLGPPHPRLVHSEVVRDLMPDRISHHLLELYSRAR
jgi:hypothetical protein